MHKKFFSKRLLRLVVLRVSCCAKCLFLYWPFCRGAHKLDPIYFVCNIFSFLFDLYKTQKGTLISLND